MESQPKTDETQQQPELTDVVSSRHSANSIQPTGILLSFFGGDLFAFLASCNFFIYIRLQTEG